jgi:hypothetical protein
MLILKRVYQFEIISQIRYQFENTSFALGSCSLPLWHKSPKTELLEPLLTTYSPFGKRYMSEDYTNVGELLGAPAKDESWSGVEAFVCLVVASNFLDP